MRTVRIDKKSPVGLRKISPRAYSTWRLMLNRCLSPSSDGYKYYGGRGIKVCKRWRTFANFLKDMGDRPAGKTIERKNNNGNYSPKNCIWINRKEQNKNRRGNHLITFNRKTMTIGDWARELRCDPDRIHARLSRGWTESEALSTPILAKPQTGIPKLLTFNGATLRVSEWAAQLGLKSKILYGRLSRGWSIELTLTTPT